MVAVTADHCVFYLFLSIDFREDHFCESALLLFRRLISNFSSKFEAFSSPTIKVWMMVATTCGERKLFFLISWLDS